MERGINASIQSKDTEMKTTKFEGKMNTGRGQTFATPIKFSGTYEEYEIPEGKGKDKILFDTPEGADKLADDDVPVVRDIYDYANQHNLNNARQKAMNDALDTAGIAKPDPNSPAVVRANFLKALEKMDMPEDKKEAIRLALPPVA